MIADEIKYPEAGEALEILLITARVTRHELRALPAQIRFDLKLTDAHELALREIVLDTINKIADAANEQIAQLQRLHRLEIEEAIASYQARMERDTQELFRELDDSTRAILRGEGT
jgi:tRNA uridine 5-carbamoylmethylation protein Kti12